MSEEPLYDAIEARYGFSLPEEYRQMRRRGWIGGKYEDDFLGPINAEWLPLEEIVEYDFGRQIGVSISGGVATRLRVVLSPAGTVITAFPY